MKFKILNMKNLRTVILVFAAIWAFQGFAQNAPVSTVGTESTNGITCAVPISVTGFQGIGACDLTLLFDHQIATVASVVTNPIISGGLPQTLTINTAVAGKVYFQWYSEYGSMTVPDGTEVFYVYFSKVASGTTAISWSPSADFDCEYYQHGSFNPLNDDPFTSYYIDGSLTFNNNAPVTKAHSTYASSGYPVTVPVTVTGFNNIGAFNLTLNFDDDVFDFDAGTNTSGYPGMTFSNPSTGVVLISGSSSSSSGVTFTDNSTLFTLTFIGNVSSSTSLTWDNDGTSCRYFGPNGSPLMTDTPTETYYFGCSVSPSNPAEWTGGTSTEWTNTANWANGTIGGAENAVTINGDVTYDPVISTDVVVNSLLIEPGASVTVASTGTLTVNYQLTNNAGTGGLVIKSSSATQTGSLLHNTTGVNATVERFLSLGTSTATDQVYHLFSAPVSGQAVTLFTENPKLFGFFRYDEFNNQWVNWGSTSPPFGDNFVVGRGYTVNFTTDQTPVFQGVLQSGTITFNTSGVQAFTNSHPELDGWGWNLIGNPYPSAIDWDAAGWTKTNINNAIYHRIDGNWFAYNDGTPFDANIIPLGQAVFVQANANPVLAMNNSVRLHSNHEYYKEQKTLENLLDITASGNDLTDHAYIHFRDFATENFDADYDAIKMFSGEADYPQIYTMSPDQTQLSIDKRSIPQENKSIPLCFKAGTNGNYYLNFTGFSSFAPTAKCILEDRILNTFTDLRTHPDIQFSYSTSDDPRRFILHFENMVGIDDPIDQQKLSLYAFGSNLYLDCSGKTGQVTFEAYNASGQKILGSEYSLSGPLTIPLTGIKGFLLVKVSGNDFTVSRKVYIN